MTINELITKGFEFAAAYVPNMDIYIDNGYVNDISPVYYENAVDALEELKTIVKISQSWRRRLLFSTLFITTISEKIFH